MKKIILLIALIFAALIVPQNAGAVSPNESAKLAFASPLGQLMDQDKKIRAVENIFKKYDSPLVDEASNYVKYAEEYGVDWRLLPAIAGLESSFGKHLMPGSHNAYGWGGGHIYFESWEEGIMKINKAIRANYMDKWGAKDVWSIGPIYAESPTWSVRVNYFMEQINQEYLRLSTFSSISTI
ncbi:MAG: hypothetical protein A2776_00340 [Candidatus Levybacteria bacterium RIFCSPHIGHO2_01_FULL_40_10]|nr:MAG: hypothetical protein A2776_00340 [Candidatus Levybacteria bacterium RIFCSPHIGHO2_01_FULL_40_10]